MQDQTLHFNGVDVDTGGWFREPMTLEQARKRITLPGSAASGRPKALVEWLDPNDLQQAGWGLIMHEDEDPAVADALEPLLVHRGAQAGGVRRMVFTEADRREGEEAIDAFFDRYGTPPGDVDPQGETLPYYLMIVGSPERIPFHFQADLDMSHASGRLYFDDVSAYARYAENLIAQEREPVRRPKKLAFFGPDNLDRITGLTSQYLIPPLAQKMEAIKPVDWGLEIVSPQQSNKQKLMSLLGDPQGPALVFTAGHGAVSKKNPSLQGSLICSEWQGGPISSQAWFGEADVLPEHDFRGTIPFFFACFSAGTPEYDSFTECGESPARLSERPFSSSLPQAMLGHRNGPLAIIAHVDQAFQFSFLWNDNILGIAHFAGMYHQLMSGCRLGYAMEPFKRRYASAMASIRRAQRRRKPMEDAYLKRWIGYQDARYYTLLGDPAVQLPSVV